MRQKTFELEKYEEFREIMRAVILKVDGNLEKKRK